MLPRYLKFWLLVCIAASTHAASRRSQGYAGSLPVGLEGFLALSSVDCSKINADPRRSRFRVPLSSNCGVRIPSPNGQSLIETTPRGGGLTLRVTGGLVIRHLMQPATVLWNPRSKGFLINDGEGSGQISRLRYFYLSDRRWRESRALDRSASALYVRRYDCRGGKNSYTNVSGWNWTGNGALRVIVQEGVHSEGCIQPHDDRNVLLEVIGNPVTGRILSAREVRTLP
jgi:hypothetical protein